jgi:hypothetical protein
MVLNICDPKDDGPAGWVDGWDTDFWAGRSASQIVHFSLADAGFCSEQREQVHDASVFWGGICDMVNDGVLLDVEGAERSNVKDSSGLARASFLAAAQVAFLGIEILNMNLASESTGLLRTSFWAGDNALLPLVDVRVMETSVEFSISARGSVGVWAEGANLGVGTGGGAMLDEGVARGLAGEGEKEGTGRAGEETSGTLNAGAWKGAGIWGSGRDVSAWAAFSTGAADGGGDLCRLGAGDSSINSSTSSVSRSGVGVRLCMVWSTLSVHWNVSCIGVSVPKSLQVFYHQVIPV